MQSHRVFKDIIDWKLSIKKLEESEENPIYFTQNFHSIVLQRNENFFSAGIIYPDELFLKSEFYSGTISDNLFLTYRLGSTYANLNVDLEKHIFFDIYAAVPSGMNANELISNSLKDAFFSHIPAATYYSEQDL